MKHALLLAFLIGGWCTRTAGAAPRVQAFILAGQSNMEGQGVVAADPKRNGGKGSLEFLATDPGTAPKFGQLRDADGHWRELKNVRIWYLGRTGNLTVGFGAKPNLIGPELGFGWVVGHALPEPVLLIKLAWGGKSLAKDFRPPSSGGEVGPFYTALVNSAKEQLRTSGAELAGIGWHQGWNDRVNQAFNNEYEKNLANLIRDLRREFGAPKLPFVIAETGMTGPAENHPRALSLMRAQAAVAEDPEFNGNVAFVSTRNFWRSAEVSPSAQGYHWNSNAETYYLIGEAMGQAMLQLCGKHN